MRQLLPLLLAPFFLALIAPSARAQEQWLPRTSGVTAHLWGVAHGDNQWVAVGEQGTILTSPDGVAWTKRPLPAAVADRWLTAVTYANRLWVAVGGTAPATDRLGLILTSPDGLAWTPRLATGPRLNAIAHGNGIFLAVDDTGGRAISADGLTWNSGTTSATAYLRGLAHGDFTFVASGATGINSTYNGIDWRSRTSPTEVIEAVAYGRKQFVAAGTNGTTYTSRDGEAWVRQLNTSMTTFRGATFFNNQFIAVGTSPVVGFGYGIATSIDGARWTERPVAFDLDLLAVAAGPNSAIAVGHGGLILQSPATTNAPTIVTQPAGLSALHGGNVALNLAAHGSFPLRYQWRRDGADLPGETSDGLFLRSVTAALAGDYSCLVTNPAGTVLASVATLVVIEPTPADSPVDPTFNLDVTLSSAPRTAVELPDGKILIGGSFSIQNQTRSHLARLHPDGSLDLAFTPATFSAQGEVRAIAVQSDGKILVGGTFSTIGGLPRDRLARLNADGSVDPSFAPTYKNELTHLAVEPGGRIYVTGSGFVSRLNADGGADPSWRGGGYSFFYGPGSQVGIQTASIKKVALRSDGKIAAAASVNLPGFGIVNLPSRANSFVVVLTAEGLVDSQYSSVVFNGPLYSPTIMDVRTLSDGRMILRDVPTGVAASAGTIAADGSSWLAGSFSTINGLPRHGLARFNPDRTLHSFTLTSGFTDADRAPSPPTCLLALQDGRVLAFGDFVRVDNVARSQAVRFNAISANRGFVAPTISTIEPLTPEVRMGEAFSARVSAAGSPAPTLAAVIYYTTALESPVSADRDILHGSSPRIEGVLVVEVRATNAAGVSPPKYFTVLATRSVPFVIRQPVPLQTNTRRFFQLEATAGGSAALSYQWEKNGVPLPGATSPRYIPPTPVATFGFGTDLHPTSAAATDTGDYRVVVRNEFGSVTSNSVHIGVDETSRLINLSTRGQIGGADAPLIFGFVIKGPGSKRVLLRGVGPGLWRFGVPGWLPDPVLRVFDGAGTKIIQNDDWQERYTGEISFTSLTVGAFDIMGSPLDSTIIATLEPGAYTAVITGKNDASGIALGEVYEADGESSRLVNLSSRGFVSPGASVMIPAFVTNTLTPPTPKKILIRGIGPTLASFGVADALANPTLSVIDSTGKTVATNDDWESNPNLEELRAITTQLAFPLAPGSKDSALLITLAPGAYSCVVSCVNNTSGTALVEVYEVP